MFTWLFGSGDKPPIFLQFRSSKTFIIIVVASAVFTDIFAYGIGTFFSPSQSSPLEKPRTDT